jgi:hypothetical protein
MGSMFAGGWSHQASIMDNDRDLNAVVEVQFGQQARHVCLDRGHAHECLRRDLRIGVTLAQWRSPLPARDRSMFGPQVAAATWARLGVSIAVWVALPLALGLIRVSRREVS